MPERLVWNSTFQTHLLLLTSGKLYIWNGWIESTLALRTPRYYGHPAHEQLMNPRRKLRTFNWNKLQLLRTLVITDLRTPLSVPTAQFYCSNSRYNGHQSASFDILAELFQIIIYFFLLLSSSLSLRLKSEQSDSRLTWSFYETTVLAKSSHDDIKRALMYINWIF